MLDTVHIFRAIFHHTQNNIFLFCNSAELCFVVSILCKSSVS